MVLQWSKCHKIIDGGFSTPISAASPSSYGLLIAHLRSTIIRESSIRLIDRFHPLKSNLSFSLSVVIVTKCKGWLLHRSAQVGRFLESPPMLPISTTKLIISYSLLARLKSFYRSIELMKKSNLANNVGFNLWRCTGTLNLELMGAPRYYAFDNRRKI